MQLKGLRLDGKFSDSAPLTWAYAKNVLLSRGFDEFENEPGDTVINNTISGDIFGRIVTPNEVLLFVHNAPNVVIYSMSTAGVATAIFSTTDTYLDCTSTTIYVEGVHCYNNEGDLIIAFTTGIHKPMIMNVTHLLSSPVTISAESQLKDYYLFPEFDHNTFSLGASSIITGGRLPSAAYFISLCYELEPGVDTNFGGISNPIFIAEADSLTAYKQFRGNGSLVYTDKAIVITVNSPDTTRNYFKLAIIQKTESGTNCFITNRIRRSSTAVNVIIDDIDKLIPFNLTEVTTSSPAFSKVKTITQSNKRLRLFNLEKPTRLSLNTIYTDVMPKLSVNWVNDTQAALNVTKNSFKDPIFIFNKRCFRSDDVYALYLGLRLKTGGFYGIYHIPGRERINAGENTNTTTVDGVAIKDYKLTSSAILDGNYYGRMGYWENENETYPSEYGALSGQKVRHHRFPSAGQLNTWKTGNLHTTPKGQTAGTFNFSIDEYLATGSNYYGIMTPSVTPALGTWAVASGVTHYNKYTALYNHTISLDLDVTFMVCSELGVFGVGQIIIRKYTLLPDGTYSMFEVNNTSETANSDPDSINLTYTGDIALYTGDYLTVELYAKSGPAAGGFTPSIENGGSTSHAELFEDLITQETLGLRIALDWNTVAAGTKAALEAVVDGWEILYAKRTLNNQLMIDQSVVIQDGAGYRFYGFDSMANLLNIEPSHVKAELKLLPADYSPGAYIHEVTNYTKQATEYSKLTKIKYLPAYNGATVPNNAGKENCYYFETTSGTFDLRLVNLINVKDDLYTDFSSQELVSTGIIKQLVQTSAFSLYGGDTFIGHNSILTFPTGVATRPKVWYFPVESILNTGMRYEGVNDYEKVFPMTDITVFSLNDAGTSIQAYIEAMIAAGIANYYFYNKDFHLLNTIRQDNIDNELTSLITKYPNRCQFSIPQPIESSSLYWRKYKILDYYDIPNAKGEIFKAVGTERIVYIQTTYSLYRGIIVDKLVTGDIDVALKSSSMFDRDVEELFDADGNYIKPWDREGMLLTPYGLVLADLDKGSVYVISDTAVEISKLGIEDWFRTTVKSTMTFGTKETIGSGVILGYDDKYKRLLLTVKNSNPSTIANLTLSFSLERNFWVAFHSYTPDKYFANANALYCLKGNDVFKMNTGNYGVYSSVIYPSCVDFIFNSNKSERFLLRNVKWVTNVENAGINYWDETINKLVVYSKNLCTGEITIIKREYSYNAGALVEQGNTLVRDGEWIYDDVKDYLITPNSAILDNNFDLVAASLNMNKTYDQKSLFITKFVIVRLIYNNTNNRKFRISNVDVDVKNIL